MQELRANTQVKVIIGPVVAVGDGFTPVTTLDLSTADEAELLKHDAAAVTSIAAATFAAISNADGYYNLTLTTSLTDTEGLLTVCINDDSLCLPVIARFMVLSEAAWDSKYVAKDDGFMDVNVKTIGRADTQETEATNLEAACAAYSVTRGLSGTALPAAAADAAGGLVISDAGGFDIDNRSLSATSVTNANTVFATDFATNYNTTADGWVVKLGDYAHGGTSANTTLGTLTVGGTASFAAVTTSGTVTLNALTVSNATTLSGAVSLGSTLGVTGTTTLAALTTTGTVTFNALTVTNATTLSGAVLATHASNDIRGVTWNSNWDAEVQSEVTDALTAAYLTPSYEDTVSSATTTSVTIGVGLASADRLVGHRIEITSGVGRTLQQRIVVSTSGGGTVFNVDRAWTVTPEAGDAIAFFRDSLPKLDANLKVQGVVLTDTVTTYTGNTPQTGDSYAIVNSGTHGNAAIKGYVDDIGVAGAGLTALGDTRLANLDATVSSRQPTIWANAGSTVNLSATTIAALSTTERDALAAALLDLANGIETGVTPRTTLRTMAAIIAGLVTGAGSGTEVFKGIGQASGGTTRATVTVDSSGNRSGVTIP